MNFVRTNDVELHHGIRRELYIIKRMVRLVAVFAMASVTAACFQPLYGERSATDTSSVPAKLSRVEVLKISVLPDSHLGIEVRNALIFNMTGGAGINAPDYRLAVKLTSGRQSVVVDIISGRPFVEDYTLEATFSLTEIATNKVVMSGQTFARASRDVTGQRYAGARALRDAGNRAAKVIADQITNRLASYFVAGS